MRQKRLLFPFLLFIFSLIFLSLLETGTFLVFARKIFYLSIITIIAHLLRKTLFYYIDLEKEFLEAKEKDPAKAFLGISIIIGLFIFGILLCFAYLL